MTRLRITDALRATRKSFLHMARDGKVQTAHDALSAILSASALAAADQLDLRNVFDVMGLILDQLKAVVDYSAAAISSAPMDGDYAVLEYRGPLPRERIIGTHGPGEWSAVFEGNTQPGG